MNLTREYWCKGLDRREQKLVYLSGILAGILPDIDLLFVSVADHRDSIIHTPFFWIVCSLSISLLAIAVKGKRRLFFGLAFALLLGSLTHVLSDAVFTGVKLFYPASNEYYRVRPPITLRYDNLFVNYVLHPIFLTEIYTFFAAGMILRSNKSKEPANNLLAILKINAILVGGAVLITIIYVLNWYIIYPWMAHY
jgi:membrane-bound metal-dependent hydrolase YbcI (DUF457 family)